VTDKSPVDGSVKTCFTAIACGKLVTMISCTAYHQSTSSSRLGEFCLIAYTFLGQFPWRICSLNKSLGRGNKVLSLLLVQLADYQSGLLGHPCSQVLSHARAHVTEPDEAICNIRHGVAITSIGRRSRHFAFFSSFLSQVQSFNLFSVNTSFQCQPVGGLYCVRHLPFGMLLSSKNLELKEHPVPGFLAFEKSL